MEFERKHLVVLVLLIVAAFAVYTLYFARSGAIEVGASEGDSSTGVVMRPYVDYYTADGRILRKYLDTGEMYWVDPETGELTPYQRLLEWTVENTLEAVTQARFGFDVSITAKYLRDVDNDGQAEVDLWVTAKIQAEAPSSSGEYVVFNNQKFRYDVGTPGSETGANPTIQSNFISIDTIHSSVWGGSPSQDTAYKPKYYVQVYANATTYWGGGIQTSTKSQTYLSSVIGYWTYRKAQLDVNLGSASSSTQQLLDLSTGEGQVTLLVVVGLVLLAALLLYGRE